MNKKALPLLQTLAALLEQLIALRGGPGSGNFGHSGCPGSVGGSCKPGGGATVSPANTTSAKPSAGQSFPPAKTVRKYDPKNEVAHQKSLTPLTDKQKETLANYTSGSIDYRTMNENLRSGNLLKGQLKKDYDSLQDAIKSAGPLPEGTTVYRGVRLGEDEQRNLVAAFRESAKTGGVVQMPGFTSTSIDPNVAGSFAGGVKGGLVFEIKPKHGAYLSSVSSFDKLAAQHKGQKENEILLADGKKYRVVDVQDDVHFGKKLRKGFGKTVVQLEEI